MPEKKKTKTKPGAKARVKRGSKTKAVPPSLLQQCRQLPGQLRKVCVDTALARYDRHYHPDREHHLHHIIVDAILAALLVVSFSFATYFLFAYRQAALHEQIDFFLTPRQSEAVSGDALGASIFVRNNTNKSLSDVYITIPSQSGYQLVRTRPAADEQGRVVIGTLRPGQSANIQADGVVLGEVDEAARVGAILHYRVSALLQEEEKLVSEPVSLTSSHVSLALDLPAALVPDKPFEFVLRYENTSDTSSFPQARIVPFLPAGLELLESTPKPADATLIWDLGNLGALQSGMVRGRAVIHDGSETSALFNFKLFASPFGKPLLQAQAEVQRPLLRPNVSVNAAGQTAAPALGGQYTQTITVRNNERFSLRDVSARLSPNLELIDRNSLPAQARLEDGKVVVPLADAIASGERKTFTLNWKLRSQVNAATAFGNDAALLRLSGELLYAGDNGQTVIIPLDLVESPLQSDARVQALGRYYGGSGEQLGRGPLPPQVGETTRYWVFLQVFNEINPLTDARVTARLPAGVQWTGKTTVTAGDALRFDAASRMVSWDLGPVADYKTNYTGQTLTAGFEVAVTPAQADLGKALTLATDVRLQARDTVAAIVIVRDGEAVTTHLTGDAYASDNGRVTL